MSEKAKHLSDIVNWGENPVLIGTARDLSLRANLPRLAITDADLGAGFHFVRQRSSNHLMLIAYDGMAQVVCDGLARPRTVLAGDAVYVRQGQRIAYQSVKGSRFAHFGLEWHDPSTAPHCVSERMEELHADPLTFRHAYQGLCREIAAGRDDEVVAAWFNVCHQIGCRTVAGERRASPIVPLRLELEKRLADKWSNDEMAAVLQISTSSLRRLCQAEAGLSPRHYLTMLRMRYAAQMLRMTSASVSDIASQIGYDSPFAFSKAFTRHHGVSPTSYRLMDE